MDTSAGELRMEMISKVFGPVRALDNVTFAAKPGTVHALCGENGAGKSTLMKILAGVYKPEGGKIIIDGRECSFSNPNDAIKAGVSMLYQELDLAEDMTVYENIFLGSELMGSMPFVIDRKAMIAETKKLCDKYGFDIDPESRIRTLTTGQCQIVELLKALMRKAKIIVMDEPTSSLSESESQRLFEIVRELRGHGIAIIYISHRIEEVVRLADEITVLRDGRTVGGGAAGEMESAGIVKLMVGRELKDFYPARRVSKGEVCFGAENIASSEGISDISFSVRCGEIVGMAGLVGAGRTEVARTIFGVVPLTAGAVKLNGKKVRVKGPCDAINNGIAMLTEDLKRTGLCVNLACSWNMTLPNYKRIGMKRLLKLRKERELCENLGRKVSVKWSGPDAAANSLSGGNQQKVLIARWLMADSQFLIFDEPTRGIDVGAKKEVYTILNELAAAGKAILVISSELGELFGICDRILVMRRGRLVGDFETAATSPEKVMHLAAIEE